jgi:hypothetical protein
LDAVEGVGLAHRRVALAEARIVGRALDALEIIIADGHVWRAEAAHTRLDTAVFRNDLLFFQDAAGRQRQKQKK